MTERAFIEPIPLSPPCQRFDTKWHNVRSSPKGRAFKIKTAITTINNHLSFYLNLYYIIISKKIKKKLMKPKIHAKNWQFSAPFTNGLQSVCSPIMVFPYQNNANGKVDFSQIPIIQKIPQTDHRSVGNLL